MRKGRFGVVLCLYPILAFACVILNQPLLCVLLFGFALGAERDEWAGRQTLQAVGLSLISTAVRQLVLRAVEFLPSHAGLFRALTVVLGVLSNLIYLAAIVCAIVAIVRVCRDREADLPGLSELAYRAYGKRKPRPFPGQVPPPYGGQPPYPPYPPQGYPQAPVPPQQPPRNGGPQA